jgi:hypothetical protein
MVILYCLPSIPDCAPEHTVAGVSLFMLIFIPKATGIGVSVQIHLCFSRWHVTNMVVDERMASWQVCHCQ